MTTGKIKLLQATQLTLIHAKDAMYHPTLWDKKRDRVATTLYGEWSITQRQINEMEIGMKNIAENVGYIATGIWSDPSSSIPEDYNPHEEILNQLNDDRIGWLLMNPSEEIRKWMKRINEVDQRLSSAFSDVFSNLKPHKIVNDTPVEMTKAEIEDSTINRTLRNIELSSIEMTWSEDMNKFKSLVESNASSVDMINCL